MNDVRKSYDALAEVYAEHFFHELERKPMDRALLEVFVDEVRAHGLVADLGCGPGHLARYLHERGVNAIGVDLSPESIATARRLSPEIIFATGSILSLPFAEASLAGIVAFYAIVNLTHDEVRSALREMARVLRPGALLLLSFHLGDRRVHFDELFGVPVALDFFFFPSAFIRDAVESAGLVVDAWLERRPYADEHPSERAYVIARAKRS
jgi:SAM-dependent methyltransferase